MMIILQIAGLLVAAALLLWVVLKKVDELIKEMRKCRGDIAGEIIEQTDILSKDLRAARGISGVTDKDIRNLKCDFGDNTRLMLDAFKDIKRNIKELKSFLRSNLDYNTEDAIKAIGNLQRESQNLRSDLSSNTKTIFKAILDIQNSIKEPAKVTVKKAVKKTTTNKTAKKKKGC